MSRNIREADKSRQIVADFLQKTSKYSGVFAIVISRVLVAIRFVREKYREAFTKHDHGKSIIIDVETYSNLPRGLNFHDVKKYITSPIKIEKTFRGRPCQDPRAFRSLIDIPNDDNLKEIQALLKKNASKVTLKETHPIMVEIALDRLLDITLTGDDD